jgi:aminopeptidase N
VYKPAVHLRPEKETVVCDFGERHFIEGTEAVLSIDYAGTINDKMTGFYRSSYVDPKTGGTKFMGVTQFEATDARKAFPCWDEPSMKATFAISITAPRDLVVLSNMDEEQTNQMGDVVEHRFRKTPVMSTYLVAWAVGELEHIETRNAHGVQVRVFTPPGEKERGRFALDVAAKTLDFFSDYFGLPYPLPKLDMLAVPDFSAGAMENWGLVTYRTVYILFDEQQSSLAIKQHVAYVVGHELAHQWYSIYARVGLLTAHRIMDARM